MTWHLSESELFDVEIEPSRFPVLWATQAGEIATPFAFSCVAVWEIAALKAGEEVSLPPNRGMNIVTKDGLGYFCGVLVKDEEEIARREEVFKKFMLKVMMNPVKYWEGYKKEMQANIDYLRNFDLEKATNLELVFHMEKAWNIGERHHMIHFLVMYPFLTAYIMFEQMCQELFGFDETDPTFMLLISGFDSRVFQIDRRLWELSKRAKELGLETIFQKAERKELINQLEQTDKGNAWCRELRSFLENYGYRNDSFCDASYPSWIEDPSTALSYIKGYFEQTQEEHSLEQVRKKQIMERKKAQKQLLSKVPKGRERLSFMDRIGALIFSLKFGTWIKNKKALELAAFLGTAQQFGVFNEEHNLYIEQAVFVSFRRIAQEVGKRLVKARALDNPEDAFYLTYSELRRYLLKAEWLDCRPLVAKRRAEYKPGGPNFIGDPSTVEMDIALAKIVGVAGRGLGVEAKEGADLTGLPASPGVAEGRARLVSATSELNTVKDGEILVSDTTWTTWTPVFARIKGLVTNIGGALSHSAIVAREYGIPAVLSTLEATDKIKTGQLIRVDGSNGTVHILEKD